MRWRNHQLSEKKEESVLFLKTYQDIPSGKRLHNYGKIDHFLAG